MKLARPVPMWQQVANHVRGQILDGTYQAGQPLPSEEALAAEFEVSRPTIREGIKTLVAEGLVEVFRPPSAREHDDWTDAGEPAFYRANATVDQADLLGIFPGEPLLVRATTQESSGQRRLARVLMPFSVAAHTLWADDPHLPAVSRLYESLQDEHDVLTWTDHVRARMPIGDETTQLSIPPGVPLLVVLRVCRARKRLTGAEHPVVLVETRQRADQLELAYSV